MGAQQYREHQAKLHRKIQEETIVRLGKAWQMQITRASRRSR